MVKISNRLQMAASLVKSGNVLADVGTDHGYVPIWLLEQKKIPRAIAMDINRGPLERAREHIRLYGMEDYIETRLSDGVAALAPQEADTILITGMGGGLVLHILEAGAEVCKSAKELVLQPQSELFRVRRMLAEWGYVTDAEEMLEEDGKYYPMMRVHYEPEVKIRYAQHISDASGSMAERGSEALGGERRQEVFWQYGRLLLEGRHPVLLEYLNKERGILSGIAEQLGRQPKSEKITERYTEIEQKLEWNREAISYYNRS